MTTKLYSIRELVEEFSTTQRTLRFYEEKGLIKPTRSAQYRSYTECDRNRLKVIFGLKRCGFSLDEIGELLTLLEKDLKEHYLSEDVRNRITLHMKRLHHEKSTIEDAIQAAELLEDNEKAQTLVSIASRLHHPKAIF